jgi:hypothetical protein
LLSCARALLCIWAQLGIKNQTQNGGSPYGYSSKQIGEAEYSVVVTGNRETSRQRVADIALLRAAYITKEQGHRHFVITQESAEMLSTNEMISAPLGGLLVWEHVGERQTEEPHAILIIRLLPLASELPVGALAADQVITEIAPRIDANG